MTTNKQNPAGPVFTIIGIVVLFVVGSIALQSFLGFFLGDGSLGISAGLSEIIFLLLPVLIISMKAEVSYRKLYKLNFRFSLKMLLFSILGILGIQLISSGFPVIQNMILPEWTSTLLKTFEKTYSEGILSLLGTKGSLIFFINGILVISIIPAIAEELVFRGYLQSTLESSTSALTAIIVSSLIFCLAHFNPVDFVGLLMIGLFFGLTAYLSKSVILSMILHFLNNITAFITIYFSYDELKSGAIRDLPLSSALYFIAGGAVVLSISILLLFREAKRYSLLCDETDILSLRKAEASEEELKAINLKN